MGARIILIPEEVQPVAGTALRPAADLSDPAERKRISPTAIQTFRQITDQKWTLTEAQSLGLLGGIASSTYQSWRIAPGGRELGQDTLTRISLVIGIFKALHGYFNDSLASRRLAQICESSADVHRPNSDRLHDPGRNSRNASSPPDA